MSALLPALNGTYGDHPDAVTVGTEQRSWEQVAAVAAQVASRIGGAPAVAVPGTATMDTVIAVVAGLMAGVPVVPIAADSGVGERGHMLTDSGATMIIGNPDWPETESGAGAASLERVAIPTDGSGGAAEGSDSRRQPGDADTAIILYTSGTTGSPKGVQIPRSAIAAGLDGLADAWQWTADDHLAHGLPLFHVHGLILGVLGPLRRGAKLTHTAKPTPDRYAAAADRGATMFFGVPTVWGRIASDSAAAASLASARVLVSGSAALPTPVFDQLRTLTGVTPIERYGMTETLITLSTRVDGERRPGSVGVPIAGVETRIVDDDNEPVAHDGVSIGNLQVRGDTLFRGYLNRPETTAESFTDDGWFVTGDAATIDAAGMHSIAGRNSVDIIKSGGYKIGAGEIESVLLAQPGVAEVAVVGIPDDDLGERVVAFVVGDASQLPEDTVLIDSVATTLSVHKRPREIRRVDSLPRNAMGKVQKHALRN